jgi:cytochrome c551/c552
METLTLVKFLKAHMANRVRSEYQSPARPPIHLVASVLLLGTLLAWWGTRDHRRLFGDLPRKAVTAAPLSVLANVKIDSAIVASGYQINQRQCAGCHEMSTRSNGPSYQEIVAFYLNQSASRDENSDLPTRLSSAIVHPRPGWGNFAPGPAQLLSREDRFAVASWLLSSFGQEKYTAKGAGK